MRIRRVAAAIAVLVLLVASCSEESPAVDYLETTTTAAGGGAPLEGAEAIAAGENLFSRSCVACHGADAGGIEGLGKGLVGTDFVQGQTPEELVAFLQVGRPADDPANTTGIPMQPRGGNPNLTDADLRYIALYLQSL